MKTQATAALAALLFAALHAIAFAAKPGERMPAVPPLANIEEGGPPISLAALKGKVVYVDFWASWCVPCRTSMPVVDEIYQRLGPHGFTVVGINKDDRFLDAQRFLKRVPVTFPVAADSGDTVVRAFSVTAMPSGYLIDRKGIVRQVHRGYTAETAKALEKDVEALLKEAP